MEREPAPASVKRSSASRYWKARLQVFKRPTVWGSALLLLLPLVFLAHYWRNPEGFVRSQTLIQTDSSTLPDDQNPSSLPAQDGTAAPAVSDASTLLEVPALPDSATEAGQRSELPQPTLLEALLSTPLPALKSQSPQPTSRPRNPFARQSRSSEPSQNRGANEARDPSSGLSSIFSSFSAPLFSSAIAQPTNSEGNLGTNSAEAMSLSPLQSALDRRAGIASSGRSSTVEGQTEAPSNLTAQAIPSAGQTTLPWLVPTGQSAQLGAQIGTPPLGMQPYIPRTSPFPGTTGYTLPSALRPTTPYYFNPTYANSSNGFSGAYSNGSFPSAYPSGYAVSPYGVPLGTVTPYSTPQLPPTLSTSPYSRAGYGAGVPLPTFNAPAPTVIPQPVPFSIPRTPPGRYIGGGEINTFSNP
jgi:hypothetical protein